jgi:hypothetical protein
MPVKVEKTLELYFSFGGPHGLLAPFFQLGHRSSSNTPANADWMCIPQPAHVYLPQLLHFTFRHMIRGAGVVY